jgi:hypothetical protein
MPSRLSAQPQIEEAEICFTLIMAKPVIWTVDDDPDVLRPVERDLRHQYGNRYRVMAADSGPSALATVEIEFESRPGETRFIVRLPVNRTPPAS